jgi:hypothetical protein
VIFRWRLFFSIFLTILIFVAFAPSALRGDGIEYLLTTVGLANHHSMDIRVTDLDTFMEENAPPPSARAVETVRQMRSLLVAHSGGWIGGFAPGKNGHYYATHFWAYSLLATPIFFILRFFNFDGLYAFPILNAFFVAGSIVYLLEWLGSQRRMLAIVFVLCGMTFYLSWPGPEVMTSCCVFVACIAALRGTIGLSLLMLGLAATQNPSVSVAIPILVSSRIFTSALFVRDSDHWQNLTRKDWAFGIAGVLLAAAPFAWSQAIYGVPSLLARYTTSLSSITWGRFLSLLADLNQGMIVGIPGILIVLTFLVPIAIKREPRRATLIFGMCSLALVGMATPVLSVSNWNSGGVGAMRYAFWLGMIPVSVTIWCVAAATDSTARLTTAALLLLQGVPLIAFGIYGGRASAVDFTSGAKWVMQNHPRFYNPEPEIFFERTIGQEAALDLNKAVVFPQVGAPLKLMRHWSNPTDMGGLCGPKTTLRAASTVPVDFGWEYLNHPFNCVPNRSTTSITLWKIQEQDQISSRVLGTGFAQPQGAGAWSQSTTAWLVIPSNQRPASRIRVHGRYYPPQHLTTVEVNHTKLGDIDLSDGIIPVPKQHRNDAVYLVKLTHPNARSPISYGESSDNRLLGFYVQIVGLEY